MRYVSPSDVIEPYSSSIAPTPSPPVCSLRIGVHRGSSAMTDTPQKSTVKTFSRREARLPQENSASDER
jgi:hypothetical protein